MSDEVKKIELETGRLRMERERLALEAEIREKDLAMSVSNAVPRLWSGLISLVKYVIGIYIVLWVGGFLGHQIGWW